MQIFFAGKAGKAFAMQALMGFGGENGSDFAYNTFEFFKTLLTKDAVSYEHGGPAL